ASQTRSRNAYVVDYATKPTLPTLPMIDWRALRPLLMLGGATLIALVGSFIVNAGRNALSIQPLIIGGILMLIGAVAVAVIAARSIAIPGLPSLEVPQATEPSAETPESE